MRCILLACLASAVVSTTLPFLKDKTCPGGQQHCEDDEPCCAFSPGSYGCCSAVEECCADDQAGVCCLAQPTYCVAKNTSLSGYPARCCPRFTVGCVAGTVGCCDPAIPWQRGKPLSPGGKSKYSRGGRARGEKKRREVPEAPEKFGSQAGKTAMYALVTNGNGNLVAWTIDLGSGNITAKVPVSGYNNNGESTRDFLFDPDSKLFMQFDVDFVGAPRPSAGRPITLSTIDPTTGQTTQRKITGGAVDYVTGFCIDATTGKTMIATQDLDESGKRVTGSSFYDVDTKSGASTLKGTLPRTGGESDPSFYAGYHRTCDGQGARRLGYKSVVFQENPGMGSVTFGNNNAVVKASWDSSIPVPDNHLYYFGARSYGGDGSFISLAPNATSGLLDVVQWKAGGSAKVLAELEGGAPRVMGNGQLGFVLDAIEGDTYVALVDKDSPVPIPYPGTWDTWAVVTVGLKTGTHQFLPLSPAVLEGTTSISGVGL